MKFPRVSHLGLTGTLTILSLSFCAQEALAEVLTANATSISSSATAVMFAGSCQPGASLVVSGWGQATFTCTSSGKWHYVTPTFTTAGTYQYWLTEDGGTQLVLTQNKSADPTTRDPLVQPFVPESIWNMPIGSGAQFVSANLAADPPGGDYGYIEADDEGIVLNPTSPLTSVYYSGVGWSGGDRCAYTTTGSENGLPVSVPIPSSYTVPNGTNNSAAVFLLSDNQSLVSMEPFARCTAGSYGTAYVTSTQWNANLYATGYFGAHGGSYLSNLGGTIRLGEMRPTQAGPTHALKIDLTGPVEFFHPSSYSVAFTWPAHAADNPGWELYGTQSPAANANNWYMVMGALLAIPSSVNINEIGLRTQMGLQLAWTLQNYGAYIVDETGGAGMNICVEHGSAGNFEDQFQSDWGFSFNAHVVDNTEWIQDIEMIRPLLSIVTNNSSSSIGGGGTPLQPLAPALPPPP